MKYANTYTVRNIEIDPFYRIKPYHLCSYAQDTVASWLADIGCASYDLQREGQSWILTGMYTDFSSELPVWRSDVQVSIWVRKIRGLQFLIDFEVTGGQAIGRTDGHPGGQTSADPDGDASGGAGGRGSTEDNLAFTSKDTLFARGTSSWSVIDESERRLIRRPDIAEKIEIVPVEACPGVQLRKILKHDGPSTTFSQTVHNYDIDFNGHLNSIRYIGGALEAIPLEYRRERVLKNIHIKYSHEAVAGDRLTCSCHTSAEGDHFYHRLFNQRGLDVAFMNTEWI